MALYKLDDLSHRRCAKLVTIVSGTGISRANKLCGNNVGKKKYKIREHIVHDITADKDDSGTK